MNISPIRTDADHRRALEEINRLWGAGEGTPEGDRLDILATLVDAYEEEMAARRHGSDRGDRGGDGA